MEFRKYQHIEKLGSSEVEGIELGKCYVFPKIDGTNSQVWLGDDGQVHCGARNRELSLDKDNAGFMFWASEHNTLRHALETLNFYFPNCRVVGEWLVPHNLKTYADTAWRRFYIFDIIKADGSHVPYESYSTILAECDYLDYIVPLRVISNPTTENLYKCLEGNNYLIKDGEGDGEGIVIKNYDFTNKYGRQTWAKIVTSDSKNQHRRTEGPPECNGTDYVEEKIVDKFLTEDIIDKVKANIELENDGFNSKNIPQLLQTVFYDLVREHSWDMVKEFKSPTINYKNLKKLVILKIKEIRPEVF